jgi:hypothetical protein
VLSFEQTLHLFLPGGYQVTGMKKGLSKPLSKLNPVQDPAQIVRVTRLYALRAAFLFSGYLHRPISPDSAASRNRMDTPQTLSAGSHTQSKPPRPEG